MQYDWPERGHPHRGSADSRMRGIAGCRWSPFAPNPTRSPGADHWRRCDYFREVSSVSTQCPRSDPAGVVLLDPPVVVNDGSFLMTVMLIVHPAKREWFHRRAAFDMKVRVFIPAGREKEKVTCPPHRLEGQMLSVELQCQFIAT